MRPKWMLETNVLPMAPNSSDSAGETIGPHPNALVPDYLRTHYWWAYIHPKAVKFFERQWLVNLILWGNYRRLRDAALMELGKSLPGATLQVACVYGDLTNCLIRQAMTGGGSIDIVDVLPIQLENLRNKLPVGRRQNCWRWILWISSCPMPAMTGRSCSSCSMSNRVNGVRKRLARCSALSSRAARSLLSTMRGHAGGIRCATCFRSYLRSWSRLLSICGGKKSPVGCRGHVEPTFISAYFLADFINSW